MDHLNAKLYPINELISELIKHKNVKLVHLDVNQGKKD